SRPPPPRRGTVERWPLGVALSRRPVLAAVPPVEHPAPGGAALRRRHLLAADLRGAGVRPAVRDLSLDRSAVRAQSRDVARRAGAAPGPPARAARQADPPPGRRLRPAAGPPRRHQRVPPREEA